MFEARVGGSSVLTCCVVSLVNFTDKAKELYFQALDRACDGWMSCRNIFIFLSHLQNFTHLDTHFCEFCKT